MKNLSLKSPLIITAYIVITVLPVLVLAGQWIFTAVTGNTDAFTWFLPSERGLQLLWKSLLLSSVVTLMAVIFGSGLALWLSDNKTPQRIIRSIYLLPLLIPPYIHSLEWMAVAGNRQVLNNIINIIPGFEDIAFSTYGFWPAVFVLTFALFPIVTLFIRRNLGALQPEIIEAGLLNDNPWRVFYRLIIPLIFPSMIAGAGLVFVLVLVDYGVPSLLQYNVYIMEVYASFSLHFDPVRAFATALPLIVIAVVLLVLSQLVLKNSPLRAQPGTTNDYLTNQWPIPARVFLSICCIFWITASMVPLIILLVRGGSPSIFYETLISSFSEIRLTIMVATIAGLLTTIIAIPLAMIITKQISRIWWLVFALPLAIPAPLVGIAMISIWNNSILDWAYGTWLILLLVQMARFLCFALFAASAGVRNIDPVLFEAAQLSNTGYLRRMTRIVLPLLTPTIITTWLITFIFSLGELGASLLVAPPGQSTLPITIYNLLHYGATDTVSAMSLIIVITAGVTSLFMLVVCQRMPRKVM